MRNLYLDNAATAFPKAPGVGDAMKDFVEKVGCNVKRGTYSNAFSAGELVYETRELLGKLFNFDKHDNIVFTMNITQSLNFLINGLLKPGDHCIVSSMEHNAVMRPLNYLLSIGVEFSRAKCDAQGKLVAEDIRTLIKPNTKAVIITHASNVCGTVLPIYDIGKICKEHGLFYIIDTAQTAGILDIDFASANADAIAFTGHKGLLGPQGIGGFMVSSKLAKEMSPFIYGGTGSKSDSELQPEYMPDKFESGTMNLPGIMGLNASLKYLFKINVPKIKEKELQLAQAFLDDASNMNKVKIVGLCNTMDRTATISLDFIDGDNGEVSYMLDKYYGISTRCGLHCAPSAHKTLGTFPNGTVRFSFSHFNDLSDASYTIDAINKILKSI